MATRLAVASRTAAADAVVDRCDTGGAGSIKIYTGAQPATPDDTATGTLLVTIALAATAYGSASSGVAALAGTPRTGVPVATGTAGYARTVNGAGSAVIDGTVTATGGGGQVELDSVSVVTGVTVSIASGTYTQPL